MSEYRDLKRFLFAAKEYSDRLTGIEANVIHIYYDPQSRGSLFDLGIAFGLGKGLIIINDLELTEDKSFSNMITAWSKKL